MARRAPLALALGLVSVVVVLIVVLLMGGGDDGGNGKGETVRGAPGRGFPLRGSLTDDDKAVDSAVSAWRKQTARRSKDDDVDQTFRGPDRNDDVTVLWAGRAGSRDTVMLEGGDRVAELTRSFDGGWSVAAQGLRDPSGAPGMPVGAGHSVVVPAGGRWHYVNASRYSGTLTEVADGLVSGNDASPEGFVLPETAPTRAEGQANVFLTGVGARTVATVGYRKLLTALDGGGARAVWRAAAEGQSSLDELARSARTREFREPQPLDLVWAGELPGRPHAAIVSQGRASGQSLALGFGEPGRADAATTEGSELLGFGGQGLAGSNHVGAIVGGAYLDVDDVPYLVLAGSGVASLHALIGDQAVTRRAPAAIVPAAQFETAGTPPDTVIYGRTAAGDVVAPLASK